MRKRKPTIKDHIQLAIDYYAHLAYRTHVLKELWKHVLAGAYDHAMWHHFELLFIDDEIAELEKKLKPEDPVQWSIERQLDLLLNKSSSVGVLDSFRLHPGLRDI